MKVFTSTLSLSSCSLCNLEAATIFSVLYLFASVIVLVTHYRYSFSSLQSLLWHPISDVSADAG